MTQEIRTNLLYTGIMPAFPPPIDAATPRSAMQALFEMRASNLGDVMDDTEKLKTMFSESVESSDGSRASMAEIARIGTLVTKKFDAVNHQAFRIGALTKEAFDVMDYVNDDTLKRCHTFMPEALSDVNGALQTTLKRAREANSPSMIELKQLCWQIESMTKFWRVEVVQRVESTMESIRSHNADIEPKEKLAR